AYRRLKRFKEARDDLTAAIRLNPRKTSYWVSRGNAHAGLDDYAAAVADFTQAIRLEPDTASHYHLRACVGWRLDERRAERDLRTAVERCIDDPDAYSLLASLYFRREDYEQGLAACDLGLARWPENAELHFHKGRNLSWLDRNDEALPCFE